MRTMKRALVGLALGLSVAALASPGFAQRREDRNNAREQAAIHECSVKAGKYSNTSQLTEQFGVYRACMAEHGMMNQ
jgi:hypothetical protein